MAGKSPSAPDEAPEMLICELLYEAETKLDAGRLRERLAAALPEAKLIVPEAGAPFLVAHENHAIEYMGGAKVPAQTAIMDGGEFDPARIASALAQTWDWPEAKQTAQKAMHQLLITEMMARALEPEARIEIFSNVLALVLELAPPLCIHSHHAERIVDPAKVLRGAAAPDSADGLAAFLNVRLFQIQSPQPGEMVMDTRGLAALGLPDLQIHFRDLEPGRVAALLYNSAMYVLTHGDCIDDGHTIQGLEPDQKWRCQHEESLVPPKRLVIDLDPGDPHAAGSRQR